MRNVLHLLSPLFSSPPGACGALKPYPRSFPVCGYHMPNPLEILNQFARVVSRLLQWLELGVQEPRATGKDVERGTSPARTTNETFYPVSVDLHEVESCRKDELHGLGLTKGNI